MNKKTSNVEFYYKSRVVQYGTANTQKLGKEKAYRNRTRKTRK